MKTARRVKKRCLPRENVPFSNRKSLAKLFVRSCLRPITEEASSSTTPRLRFQFLNSLQKLTPAHQVLATQACASQKLGPAVFKTVIARLDENASRVWLAKAENVLSLEKILNAMDAAEVLFLRYILITCFIYNHCFSCR